MSGSGESPAAVRRRWVWPVVVVGAVVAMFAGAAVAGGASLGGCCGGLPAAGGAGEAADAASAGAGPITTLGGTAVTVPAAGGPTAVYFFSTGCAACVPPLRALAEVAGEFPQVTYLPVSVSPYDDARLVNGFLAAADDAGRDAALDPQAELAAALEVVAQGTLIVYDRSGSEVFRGVDPPADQVRSAFAQAVGG